VSRRIVMENNEFKKIWNSASDALYNPQETAKILKSFNDAIHGLYSIGGEEQYIFNALNTSTPVIKEYERLTKSMGISLIDVANMLEIMRNLLFGDCFNWDAIYEELEL
jgi:hypothetical protein